MIVELSGFKKLMFYVAALLVGFCGMAEMGVNPAINGIFETYGYGLGGTFAVSVPTVTLSVSAFACAALMRRFTKKRLIVVGTAVFAVSSIFAGVVDNLAYFIVMRALMGVGEGVTNTVILAYLAQMYIDQEKHASFVGVWNFVYTLFGAILSTVAGILAVPEWTNLFLVYSPSIVILIVVVVFLPELGMETMPDTKQADNSWKADARDKLGLQAPSKAFGKLFWTFWASFMIFSLVIAVYMYFLSELVEVTGMGTYDTTGLLMMAYMLGGALVSLVFGKLFMALKKKLAVCNILLLMVGMLMLYFGQGNIVMYYVASALNGIAFGAQYAYMYTMVVEMCPLDRVDAGISLITGGYGAMYFFASYIVNGLRGVLSPDTMVVTPQFLLFGILCVLPLAIELVMFPAYGKRHAELEAAGFFEQG